MSISLHPGTNLSRHAGSLLDRVGRVFKFAMYYVISCGDLTFVTDESKALAATVRDGAANAKTTVRDGAENTLTNLETGELPDMNGIDIADSHGAITSLFAGTAPEAGDYNGKVCYPAPSTAALRRNVD